MATKFGSPPSAKVTMTRHSGSPVRTARLTLSGESHMCPGPQVSHSSTPGIFPSPRAVFIGSESGSDATGCA
jgi:hypothetical protein